jgi:hypothetical protein
MMPVGNPNGYGSVALNAMGGHTQRTPGQRFISPVNAGAQMTPARMAAVRPPLGARVSAPPRRPIASRPPPGGQYNRGRAGAVSAAAKDAAPNPVKEMEKIKPIKKSFISNRGLAIGAGAAVIGGLAMNRRGSGTSSGRSGMTRY